jgi:hypothetical protein
MQIIIELEDVNALVDFANNMVTLEFKRPFEVGKGDTVIINEAVLGSIKPK